MRRCAPCIRAHICATPRAGMGACPYAGLELGFQAIEPDSLFGVKFVLSQLCSPVIAH